MKVLREIDGIMFCVDSNFDVKYLEPILHNLSLKLKNNWDDYNELYHCCKLIESIRKNPNTWIDTHIIIKDERILGVTLIEGGQINLASYIALENFSFEENSVMLNYFHIIPEGRGNGERWLRDIIIPYYNRKGIINIYLKSSHEKSFSLYGRLGSQIGEYCVHSDNQIYLRKGKIFQIRVKNIADKNFA